MTKDEVLRMLKENGDYVSGQKISEELNVSRMAVSKAVASLKNEGFNIDSKPHIGYKLKENGFNYGYSQIMSYCDKGTSLKFFESLDSTNNYLKSVAQEYKENKVCAIAKVQTGGRGRRGHSFSSEKGIYLSVLMHPHCALSSLACLTAFAGVCVAEAIKEVTGVQTQIKWVNDVLLEGKKICGILTELSFEAESSQCEYAIIGIGINTDSRVFPEEIRDVAGTIEDITKKPVDKSRLAAEIIKKVFALENELKEKHDEYFKKYEKLCITLGKRVKVMCAEPYEASAVGLAEDCSLIVKKDSGKEEKISFGEVSVRGVLGYGK